MMYCSIAFCLMILTVSVKGQKDIKSKLVDNSPDMNLENISGRVYSKVENEHGPALRLNGIPPSMTAAFGPAFNMFSPQSMLSMLPVLLQRQLQTMNISLQCQEDTLMFINALTQRRMWAMQSKFEILNCFIRKVYHLTSISLISL